MSATLIAVIDTGICNLRSVTKAVEASGGEVRIVHTPAELAASAADGLVLPGVGALRDCVASLRSSGLADHVAGWIREDRPFLGVCLGMQALFDRSEEGAVRGLFSPTPPWRRTFPSRVKRFILYIASTACPEMRTSCSRLVIMAGSSARPSVGGT
jgi:imidazole glycerol-phosphate synthase subunit HisH